MTEVTVSIKNRAGIHARPAALIVQTASKFASNIWLEKGSDRINAKSIMGIITLGASYGTPLRITRRGQGRGGRRRRHPGPLRGALRRGLARDGASAMAGPLVPRRRILPELLSVLIVYGLMALGAFAFAADGALRLARLPRSLRAPPGRPPRPPPGRPPRHLRLPRPRASCWTCRPGATAPASGSG